MKKGGVSGEQKRGKVVSNQWQQQKGLLDGSASVTDGVVVVGSLDTQSLLSFVLKGPVRTQL